MTRRPDVQWKPEVMREPRASAAQSVPCPFTPGCGGRTDYLTHEILGTVERCRRCGKRERITGREVEGMAGPPRDGTCSECGKRVPAASRPERTRTTCSRKCQTAAQKRRAGAHGAGTRKPRRTVRGSKGLAQQLEVRL